MKNFLNFWNVVKSTELKHLKYLSNVFKSIVLFMKTNKFLHFSITSLEFSSSLVLLKIHYEREIDNQLYTVLAERGKKNLVLGPFFETFYTHRLQKILDVKIQARMQ